MSLIKEYLNPGNKLVDEVVAWLCGDNGYEGRIKNVAGALSLAHIMVVVPTAQSSRSLRLKLAKRFEGRGIISPRVVSPIQLIEPREMKLKVASPIEIAAAFQQYAKKNRDFIVGLTHIIREEEFDDLATRFSLLNQLEDIWKILAGRGLLMKDVLSLANEILAEDIGEEVERWEELAKLEEGFFRYLEELGFIYQTKKIHDAKTDAAIVSEEIEEIVLPSLADPIRVFEDVILQQLEHGKKVTALLHIDEKDEYKFDELGRPKTECWIGKNKPELSKLENSDIIITSDFSSLARRIADDFPCANGKEAIPTLSLCDSSLYNNVAGAFLAKGYVVHNPARHTLSNSSLGRMIKNLIAIYEAKTIPWEEFVLFFRNDDVLSALGLFGNERVKILEGLDVAQNAYIPIEIPPMFNFPDDTEMKDFLKVKFDAFCEQGQIVEKVFTEARKKHNIADFIRGVLKWVFAKRKIERGAAEKEFMAAIASVRETLNILQGDLITALNPEPGEMIQIARRAFDSSRYSLEPDAADVIKTEGWLELAWTAGKRIALAGMHEGKVPDSVVGHSFLPDKLRAALGLTSNNDRLARDTWLLTELLSSHDEHFIHAYISHADDLGDICRPSRLLYLCSNEKLADRTEYLFGDIKTKLKGLMTKVDWEMKLPDAIETPKHFSPSALDTYIKCPFTYLLKYGLKMTPFKEKEELGADDFGTLAHAALRMYAEDQIKRGNDQLTDEREIMEIFEKNIFPEIRKKYENASLNIELQLQALEGRISLFASRQASWASEGWRIRMAEKEIPENLSVNGFDFNIHGFIDRVDENINDIEKPWCIIDYKTWDEKSGFEKHVIEKNKKNFVFAKRMGYPLFTKATKKGDIVENGYMLSVQLPIYGKCLASLVPEADFRLQKFTYLILGKNEDEVGFETLTADQVECSILAAKKAVENISDNIFWPPGPHDDWKWDFKGLFVEDPLRDLEKSKWAIAQNAKTEVPNV